MGRFCTDWVSTLDFFNLFEYNPFPTKKRKDVVKKMKWKGKIRNWALMAAVVFVVVSATAAIFLYTKPGYLVYEDEVEKAVMAEGYTNVIVGDRSVIFASGWFGQCKKDDHAEFQVTACNRNGDEVELVVCGRVSLMGTSFTIRIK